LQSEHNALQIKYCNNFGIKDAEIVDRVNLRSLAIDDLSELSRTKLDQDFSFTEHLGINFLIALKDFILNTIENLV